MWMAPSVFRQAGGQSAVFAQPAARDPDASAALVACPTGSIGGPAAHVEFPRPVAPEVWHCGYHDRHSFGAASYLVRTDEGNVLVDVPRFAAPLVQAIEALGGLQHILLTHRDDVAAHQKWHDHFGAPRSIHTDDAVIEAEHLLVGEGGRVAGLDWLHVPGHSRGSVVYRFGSTLFTGDHLAGRGAALTAFRNACWFDWPTQTRSMERLAGLPVQYVFPGHGAPWHGAPEDFQESLQALLMWMRAT